MDSKYIKLSISAIVTRMGIPLLILFFVWYSSPLFIGTLTNSKKNITSYFYIVLMFLLLDNFMFLIRVIKNKRIYLEIKGNELYFYFRNLCLERKDIVSVKFKKKNISNEESEYLEVRYKKNILIRKIIIKKGLCNITLDEVSRLIKGYI